MSVPSILASPVRVGFIGVRHPHVFARERVLLADARATVVGFFEQDAEIGNQVKNELGLERFHSQNRKEVDGMDDVTRE